MVKLKSLTKSFSAKKINPPTKEEQDIIDQIAIIQPIVQDNFKI